MSGNFVSGMSSEAIQRGFYNTLRRSGVSEDLVQRISATISSLGGFDGFIDLYKDRLGDK